MILRFGLRPKKSAGMGWFALVAMVVMAAATSPAFAQTKDLQALLDRMERLERDIKTINVHLAKGGPLPAASAAAPSSDPDPAIARLGLRLTELEDELRSTTGRIEELTHLVGQIGRRMDKLVGDVDYRLNALEQRSAAAGGGAARMAAPPPPPSASAFGPAPVKGAAIRKAATTRSVLLTLSSLPDWRRGVERACVSVEQIIVDLGPWFQWRARENRQVVSDSLLTFLVQVLVNRLWTSLKR